MATITPRDDYNSPSPPPSNYVAVGPRPAVRPPTLPGPPHKQGTTKKSTIVPGVSGSPGPANSPVRPYILPQPSQPPAYQYPAQQYPPSPGQQYGYPPPMNQYPPSTGQSMGTVPVPQYQVPKKQPKDQLPAPPLLTSEEIQINKTSKIYMKRTLKGCCYKSLHYDVYPGTKSDHDSKLLTIGIFDEKCVCICCNCCGSCCCTREDGDYDWPMTIRDSNDKEYGMMTLTESGKYPMLIHLNDMYLGRMRSSYSKFCICCKVNHHDIMGSLDTERYSTKGGACFENCPEALFCCLGPCAPCCVALSCGCCFGCCCGGLCGNCDCPFKTYQYDDHNDPAFKLYEICTCYQFCCYCCSNERHYEIHKVGKNFPESPILLLAPAIGHTMEG